jgi:hypothetical protein
MEYKRLLDKFCGDIGSLLFKIDDYERFIREFEKYRSIKWKTRVRKEIKISDLTNSHLDNIINFINNKSPEWIKIFNYEKQYREYKKELPSLIEEYNYYQDIMHNCL